VDHISGREACSAFADLQHRDRNPPVIGPTLGAGITDSYSWRWVFFINIPKGCSHCCSPARSSPIRPSSPRSGGRIKQAEVDYIGILLVAVGFGCLEVVLDKGEREDWLQSSFIVAFLSPAVVALVVGVIWELYAQGPVVDLTLLKERTSRWRAAVLHHLLHPVCEHTPRAAECFQNLFNYNGDRRRPSALARGAGHRRADALDGYDLKKGAAALEMAFGLLVCAFASLEHDQVDMTADYNSFVIPAHDFGARYSVQLCPLI